MKPGMVKLLPPLKTRSCPTAPQHADKAGQRDHRVQKAHRQAHRLRGEQVHVFLQALVGVVGHALAGLRQAGVGRGGFGLPV
jgi:hypothetical protein